MNELEQLLALLGVQTFAQAAASISAFSTFLDAAKQSTGKDKADEALTELQARAARAPFAISIEKATGKSGDEAVGLIHAALASHAELPRAQARVAELEQQTQAHALDALFAKAKDEKRWTKAIEDSVRAAFTAKEVTLKGAEAWLANLTPVAALKQRQEAAPNQAGPASALKWNEKSWDELKPSARAQLKRENPDLYAAMRPAN